MVIGVMGVFMRYGTWDYAQPVLDALRLADGDVHSSSWNMWSRWLSIYVRLSPLCV
jgi:hypothetical protein